MPIEGRFYTVKELQKDLAQTRQGIYNLARRHKWITAYPGLYQAKEVEDYLKCRASRKSANSTP